MRARFPVLPPLLVVTRITPFAPRAPYIAADEASLSTSIDSISFGFKNWKLDITTPSTTYSGLAEAFIVEIPLIITLNSPPG